VKYRLVDLLACPMDKAFPLQLIVLNEEAGQPVQRDKVACEIYCSYKERMLQGVPEDWVQNCRVCLGINIKEGVLSCPQCGRWYPIMETIPRMLPDELRSKKEDILFLERYSGKLPRNIVERGPVGQA
jgi:uncharacterized protein YbaR (Trm112 family)